MGLRIFWHLPMLLIVIMGASSGQAQRLDCPPVNGFGFNCGMERPEDLKVIPDTRWLIASGFRDGALVATVLLHPGTTLADQVQGRVTGVRKQARTTPSCNRNWL